MDEKDIIASVLRGETERFGILAERYSAPIYRLCVSLCGNSADAEDCSMDKGHAQPKTF